MVPEIVDFGLLGAYLLLLGLVAVQFYRGAIASHRLSLLLGMCCTWLSYSLLQVTQGGPIATGTPLNYALDGLAVLSLVAGLYGLYRWWRHRDGETNDGVSVS